MAPGAVSRPGTSVPLPDVFIPGKQVGVVQEGGEQHITSVGESGEVYVTSLRQNRVSESEARRVAEELAGEHGFTDVNVREESGRYRIGLRRAGQSATVSLPAYTVEIGRMVFSPVRSSPPTSPITTPAPTGDTLKDTEALEGARWTAMANVFSRPGVMESYRKAHEGLEKAAEASRAVEEKLKKVREYYDTDMDFETAREIEQMGRDENLVKAAGLVTAMKKLGKGGRKESPVGSYLGLNLGGVAEEVRREYEALPEETKQKVARLMQEKGKDFLENYYRYYHVEDVTPAELAATAAGEMAFGWVPIGIRRDEGGFHIKTLDTAPVSTSTWGDEYKNWIRAGKASGVVLSVAIGEGMGTVAGAGAGAAVSRAGGIAVKGGKVFEGVTRALRSVPGLRRVTQVVSPVAKAGARVVRWGAPKLATKPGQAALFAAFEAPQAYSMYKEGVPLEDIGWKLARDTALAGGFERGFTKTIEPAMIERATRKASEKMAIHKMPDLDKFKVETVRVRTWEDLANLVGDDVAEQVAKQSGKARFQLGYADDLFEEGSKGLSFSERLARAKSTPIDRAYVEGKRVLDSVGGSTRIRRAMSDFRLMETLKPTEITPGAKTYVGGLLNEARPFKVASVPRAEAFKTPIADDIQVFLNRITAGKGGELMDINKVGDATRTLSTGLRDYEQLIVVKPRGVMRTPLGGGGIQKSIATGLTERSASEAVWNRIMQSNANKFWLSTDDYARAVGNLDDAALMRDLDDILRAGKKPAYVQTREGIVFKETPVKLDLGGARVQVPGARIRPTLNVRNLDSGGRMVVAEGVSVENLDDFLRSVESDYLKSLVKEKMWRGATGPAKVGYTERYGMTRFAADDAFKAKKGFIIDRPELESPDVYRTSGVGDVVNYLKTHAKELRLDMKKRLPKPGIFKKPFSVIKGGSLVRNADDVAGLATEVAGTKTVGVADDIAARLAREAPYDVLNDIRTLELGRYYLPKGGVVADYKLTQLSDDFLRYADEILRSGRARDVVRATVRSELENLPAEVVSALRQGRPVTLSDDIARLVEDARKLGVLDDFLKSVPVETPELGKKALQGEFYLRTTKKEPWEWAYKGTQLSDDYFRQLSGTGEVIDVNELDRLLRKWNGGRPSVKPIESGGEGGAQLLLQKTDDIVESVGRTVEETAPRIHFKSMARQLRAIYKTPYTVPEMILPPAFQTKTQVERSSAGWQWEHAWPTFQTKTQTELAVENKELKTFQPAVPTVTLTPDQVEVSPELKQSAKEWIKTAMEISPQYSYWMDVSKPEHKISQKTGWKIHVSVHPEEYTKALESILPVVLQYRDAYGVGAKFVVPRGVESLASDEVQRGKMITIYVPDEIKDVAPRLIRDIETVIRQNRIKTYLPSPNEEVVGTTGAITTAYSHFGGGEIIVPEPYREVYGKEKITDVERRYNRRYAVPEWKKREFTELFREKLKENALSGVKPEVQFVIPVQYVQDTTPQFRPSQETVVETRVQPESTLVTPAIITPEPTTPLQFVWKEFTAPKVGEVSRPPVMYTIQEPEVYFRYPQMVTVGPAQKVRTTYTPVTTVGSIEEEMSSFTPVVITRPRVDVEERQFEIIPPTQIPTTTQTYFPATTTFTPVPTVPPTVPPIIPPVIPPMMPPVVPPFVSRRPGEIPLGYGPVAPSGVFGYWVGATPFLGGGDEEEVIVIPRKPKTLEEKLFRDYFLWLVSRGLAPTEAARIARELVSKALRKKGKVEESQPQRRVYKNVPLTKQSLARAKMVKARAAYLRH